MKTILNKECWMAFSERNMFGHHIRPKIDAPVLLRAKGPLPIFVIGFYRGGDKWLVTIHGPKHYLSQQEMEDEFSHWRIITDPGG